jgi:hypothetical protein
MKVLVTTIWKESIRLSADDTSALEQYSFLHWLDCAFPAATTLPSESVCLEEPELGGALEDFLFTAQFSDRSTSSKLQTGFGQWHKLGQLLKFPEHLSEDSYGEQTGQAHDDEENMEPGQNEDERWPPVHLTWFSDWRLPEAKQRRVSSLPSRMVLPAFIWAILGIFCDVSHIEPAFLDINLGRRSRYDWEMRSLAAVMTVDDIRPVTWLIQQLKPQQLKPLSQVVRDALALKFVFSREEFDDYAKWRHYDEKEQERILSTTTELLDLVIEHGMQLGSPTDPSASSLMIELIRADNLSRDRRPDNLMRGVRPNIALTIASMISRGVDPFILIYRDDVITSQSEEGVLDNGISSHAAKDNAESKTSRPWTLLDYLLLMGCPQQPMQWHCYSFPRLGRVCLDTLAMQRPCI